MKKIMLISAMILISLLFAQNVEETLTQIDSLKAEILKGDEIIKGKLEAMKKDNPLLALEKDPFESDEEYRDRMRKAKPQLDVIKMQVQGDLIKRLALLRNKFFETSDIIITLNGYDANIQIYDVKIEHLNYQKETYDVKMHIERDKAREIYTNWETVIKKGILNIEFGDRISLVRIVLENPNSDYRFVHDIQTLVEYPIKKIASNTFSSDGEHLAIINKDNRDIYNRVCFYDLSTNVKEGELSYTSEFTATASISPDLRFLSIGEDVYNTHTNQKVVKLNSDLHDGDYIVRSVFSPDSKYLATCSNYLTWELFNADTGENLLNIINQGYEPLEERQKYAVTFSSDSRYVASINTNNNVKIVNFNTGQRVMDFISSEGIKSISFSPNGEFVALGCLNNIARIFNIQNQNQIVSFINSDEVIGVLFSQDSEYLVVSCKNNKTFVYNIENNKLVASFDGNTAVALSPDNKYIAIGNTIFRTLLNLE